VWFVGSFGDGGGAVEGIIGDMSVVEGEVSPTFAVVDTIAEERWLSADSEGWKQCESQDGPERDEADQRV
jgi:hypothetical protein